MTTFLKYAPSTSPIEDDTIPAGFGDDHLCGELVKLLPLLLHLQQCRYRGQLRVERPLLHAARLVLGVFIPVGGLRAVAVDIAAGLAVAVGGRAEGAVVELAVGIGTVQPRSVTSQETGCG